MTIFWLSAAGMIVFVLLVVAFALRGTGRVGRVVRKDINLEIFRQRSKDLEAEHQAGDLDDAAFEAAKLELQRTLLDDLEHDDSATEAARGPGAAVTLAGVTVFVIAAAVGLYVWFGAPTLLRSELDLQAVQEIDKPAVATAHEINHRVRKLRQQPDDIKGWLTLAQLYIRLGSYTNAIQAYGRALRLAPEDEDLLMGYVETLIYAREPNALRRAEHVLTAMLARNADNDRALWLLGHLKLQNGDAAAAVQLWTRLQKLGTADERQQRVLEEYLGKARQAMGAAAAPSSTAAVTVKVEVDPELVKRAQPTDTVFIYARAAQGPRVPLAVVRKQVKDLPLTAKLDDSMAMTPAMRISAFPEVTVSARISRSGNATPQSGDLSGSAGPVKVADSPGVTVTIDQIVP